MDQSPDELDPYDLLEIPAEFRPPTHYQLLGVDDFETDLDLIAQAAKQRGAYLHQIAAGSHRKAVQQLMGEIAIARRTLLSDQSKAEYDQQLAADTEEYEAEQASGQFQVETAHASETEKSPAKKSTDKGESATRSRRRKKSAWDEYKLHLASASILLLIVGVVWFVNRGSGERRAAEAGRAQRSSPVESSRASNTPARSARPRTRSLAAQPPRQQVRSGRSLAPKTSPPSQPRRSGGSSLTPDFGDFDVNKLVNSDEPEMTKPAPKDAPRDASSKSTSNAVKPPANAKPAASGSAKSPSAANTEPASGGKQNGYSTSLDLTADWKPEIKPVAKLGSKLPDLKKLAVKFQDDRLVIQKAGPTKYGAIKVKQMRLAAGQAVSIQTNLKAGLKHPVTIGLTVGPARLMITSGNERVQVRAKLGSGKETKPVALGSLSATDPITLLLFRESGNKKRLRWLVRSGEENLSGQMEVASLKSSPQNTQITFSAPEQQLDPPIWIDDLRLGPCSKTPTWKSTELLKL